MQGEPNKVSLCFCAQCRKRTGSAFGIVAFFDRAAVRAEGEAASHTRAADGGHVVTFHFCPTCGSSLWWEPSRKPDMVGVAAGAFDEGPVPPPDQAVNREGQPGWLRLTLDDDGCG